VSEPFETNAVHLAEHQRPSDYEYYRQLNDFFSASPGTNVDKLRAFAKYVPVAELGRFLAKYEIFQRVLNVQGSIIECGVFKGGGLLTWAVLSAILEPLNHVRKVIGFDSFEGFLRISEQDRASGNLHAVPGGLKTDSCEDILEAIRIFDIYRPLGHIQKVDLVRGDAMTTIPAYVQANPHLVVSLLYLDFDVYEPTRLAIEQLRPRIPRGGIIAFDQLNLRQWPGETQALSDALGISSLRIERFPFQPQISFAVLE
jgi:hypothetical protein